MTSSELLDLAMPEAGPSLTALSRRLSQCSSLPPSLPASLPAFHPFLPTCLHVCVKPDLLPSLSLSADGVLTYSSGKYRWLHPTAPLGSSISWSYLGVQGPHADPLHLVPLILSGWAWQRGQVCAGGNTVSRLLAQWFESRGTQTRCCSDGSWAPALGRVPTGPGWLRLGYRNGTGHSG